MINIKKKYPVGDIREVLTNVRGYFPGSVYVGGSYARSLVMGGSYQDIDIFVLMPRSFERWALIKVLNLIFEATKSSKNLFRPNTAVTKHR